MFYAQKIILPQNNFFTPKNFYTPQKIFYANNMRRNFYAKKRQKPPKNAKKVFYD